MWLRVCWSFPQAEPVDSLLTVEPPKPKKVLRGFSQDQFGLMISALGLRVSGLGFSGLQFWQCRADGSDALGVEVEI